MDNSSKHKERIASAVGGFIAVFTVFMVSQWFVGSTAAAVLVASMGASAVLLFAVPHGPLSQPWSLFGGHLLSAIIGVSCANNKRRSSGTVTRLAFARWAKHQVVRDENNWKQM